MSLLLGPYLTDEALDDAILRALYPDKQKTEIELSAEIVNSGGAVRTGIRCDYLQHSALIFVVRTARSLEVLWKLTTRGRLAQQQKEQ